MQLSSSSLIAWAALAASLVAGGCSSSAGLSALMSDDEVRQVVAREFPKGASLTEVQTRLDALNISRKYQMHYPPTETRPEVLLVRLFKGGFWLNSDDDFVDWLDLSLVFEQGGFDRALLYRDRVRYFEGDPVNPPTRRAAGPMRYYPGAIPPPVDPLEGAK